MPSAIASAGLPGVRAVDGDRAFVGQVNAGGHLHQRRLAGAVAADQSDDLAGGDIEIHTPQRDDAAEGFLDPPKLELCLCLRRGVHRQRPR